ncbi:hypothetical protein ScalyP_jg3840 [Parmales sp. scaly parma]|nr:hypothetical protein ScalyP_jg3840 [Parmales sp. scaly parma]
MIDEVLSRTNPDARILVVGDGDLSFSKSLSEAIISTSRTLTASVLEASEFELVNNYPSSPQNIAKIHTLAESNSKIKLLFNVNATSLDHSIPTSSMSLIIFNFPQTPPETNTHRKVQFQRLLISNFLASALQILSDDVDSDSKIFLTLARGQGGIEYIEKSNLRPNEKDSWQVGKTLAGVVNRTTARASQ